MGKFVIDKLIINSPYEEPKLYWRYERETPIRAERRSKASWLYYSFRKIKVFRRSRRIPRDRLVNDIRNRVKKWQEAGYPGVTGISKRLIEHWKDTEQREYHKFFFCQLEAIETVIWLNEAPDSEKVGIVIPSDGGDFKRLCCKMATGTGKTIVMAMLIAWQVLNKVTYPQDTRFSKNIFIVAPGLTVKIVLESLFLPVKVIITKNLTSYLRALTINSDRVKLSSNWQALNWETEERFAKKKTVDKRGPLSDEAYVREVLGDMANANNIIVINDEAHHAWRVPPKSTIKGIKKEDIEEATKWVGGLDRINKARGILPVTTFQLRPSHLQVRGAPRKLYLVDHQRFWA